MTTSDEIAATLIKTPERMAILCEFIDSRLAKSRLFDKYGLTLTDSNEVIVASLMGELRNMVLAFFRPLRILNGRFEHWPFRAK